MANASQWLTVSLAAISQEADLHCESEALRALLRIYIANNVGPAHFVSLVVEILYLEKRVQHDGNHAFLQHGVFIKLVHYNLTVNKRFIVIFMLKKINNFVGLSRYMS